MGKEHVIELFNNAKDYVSEAPRPLCRETVPSADFPVQVLPEILAHAVRAIHDIIQSPLAICGQSVMAAATLAIQPHANVKLPTGQERPLNNFYFTVAESGERKSSCDKEALSPIRLYEEDLRADYARDYGQWKNMHEIWERDRKRIVANNKLNKEEQRKALNELGDEPVAPLNPILLCPDNTIEGITKHLTEGLPSIGWFSSEGGSFIGGHSMSRDNRLKTISLLSLAWDGEPLTRIRAGEASVSHRGKRISMHMMMQPGVAATVFANEQFEDQGLLSRILPAAPNSIAGTRLYREPSPESREHLNCYSEHLLKILHKPARVTGKSKNELTPRSIALSDEAKSVWIGFADHVERMIGKGGKLEPIKSLGNKLPEHAARLAALLTLVDNIEAETIPFRWMTSGIALAEYYAHEALRIVGRSATVGDLALAQRLSEWLHHSWSDTLVSLPDIYTRGLNAISDTTTARRMVAILVEHGHLSPVEGGACIKGVKRRDVWQIVGKESKT